MTDEELAIQPVKEAVIAYTIVESTSIDELIKKVNYRIEIDWEPIGGVCVTHEHKDDKDFTGHTVFFQSMIRRGLCE